MKNFFLVQSLCKKGAVTYKKCYILLIPLNLWLQ